MASSPSSVRGRRHTSSSSTAPEGTASASSRSCSRSHARRSIGPSRARVGERPRRRHRAQHDDRSGWAHDARRLPRLNDRQQLSERSTPLSKMKASHPTWIADTKTAACVGRARSHTWVRSTGPTRDRSANFSGSPNGCSMAGRPSASATFTNRYAATATRSTSIRVRSRKSGPAVDRIHREARGPIGHSRGLRAHQARDQ